jgi:hypothetical protein
MVGDMPPPEAVKENLLKRFKGIGDQRRKALTPPKASAPTYPPVPQVSSGKTPVHFGKDLDIDFVSHFQN